MQQIGVLIIITHFLLTYNGVRSERNLEQADSCQYDYIDPACQPEDAIQDMIMGASAQVADSKDYPFMVSLQAVNEEPTPFSEGCFTHFCGGTLISSNMLLTAAHCFDGYLATGVTSGQPSNPIYVAISPQCRHLNNPDGEKRIPINQIFIHPDYDRNSNNADLAVATLLGMFDDTPISIDDGSQDLSEGNNGNNLTVVGYGYTRPEERLLKVVYPVHQAALNYVSDEAVCQGLLEIAGTDTSYLNYEVMFCAYAVGADTCQGDSGGPLASKTSDGWKQVGIVSWGPASQCASSSATQAVGVFTRISAFTEWINQMIEMYGGEVSTTIQPTPQQVPASDEQQQELLEVTMSAITRPLSIFGQEQQEAIAAQNSDSTSLGGVTSLEVQGLLAARGLPNRIPIGSKFNPKNVRNCQDTNGRKLQQIIGVDDRVVATELDCYPIFGIGKIYFGTSLCGITMIKDDVAVTVGSCFKNEDEEVVEGPLNVEFQNGWKVGVQEIKFMDLTSIDISTSDLFSLSAKQQDQVVVILKLEASVGYLTGWLGLPGTTSVDLTAEVAMVEIGENNMMTRQECALQGESNSDLILHSCDTSKGRGWPLYMVEESALVALHASGPASDEFSKALSLFGAMSILIENVIKENWDN